ncbi:hypothetical protein V5O48_019280, partial [Marasmius crinis-equi]
NLSMARQPREGSEEFDQRQKAYQRVMTPRDSSQAQKTTNPPAQTFASALRIRGMIQLLHVFDARDGTSSNIPDQHVRLWQDKDNGTVVANDPKYPGDQVDLPDYPHEEYDRLRLQYQERWNEGFQKRMDDRWNSTKKEARSGNPPMSSRQPNDRPSNAPKKNLRFSFKGKDGSCYACRGFGHFMNDPKCPKKTEKVHFARMMEEDEVDDETTFYISAGSDSEVQPDPGQMEQEGDAYAAALYDNEYEADDLYACNGYSYEQTYLTNEEEYCEHATARLSTLMEEPYIDYDNAEFPHEEGVMDYGDFMAGIQEIP